MCFPLIFVMKVKKKSGKPFLSGLKINTVKDITINPYDPKHRQAYSFLEDNSVVNCDICEKVMTP